MKAAAAGKWPLKWYAPECIYYFRFDSKSDVWSFGVTLWEVYSYGDRPYKDMKGAQILTMLDQGLRLCRPLRCPEAIYSIMQDCWNFEGVRRPTFAELVLLFSRLVAQSSVKPTSSGGMTATALGIRTLSTFSSTASNCIEASPPGAIESLGSQTGLSLLDHVTSSPSGASTSSSGISSAGGEPSQSSMTAN
ncbi:unnamed protein product [Protopolystoma xenopodis]|uniref:Protein kinase domain-containing protein n=1 Tax=Protopolystoma xenopodis TaxID=117903 RepID=A0A3S5AEM3_9PLAT|nr:unnamed protein product [Protopolystoma xenopodis]